MNKYTWYVVQEQNAQGLLYAYAYRVRNYNNLLSVFERIKDAISVNACDSAKEAKEIADNWNERAKTNGKYALA